MSNLKVTVVGITSFIYWRNMFVHIKFCKETFVAKIALSPLWIDTMCVFHWYFLMENIHTIRMQRNFLGNICVQLTLLRKKFGTKFTFEGFLCILLDRKKLLSQTLIEKAYFPHKLEQIVFLCSQIILLRAAIVTKF